MADNTKIEWTDATWNPITGCSVVSPGCTNCYAMKLAGGRLKNVASRKGLTRPTKAGPVWTGAVRFNKAELLKPLKWKRPRRIFPCAHGDLFHEKVKTAWIVRTFAIMALCPQHSFQVLTKRSDRMRTLLSDPQFEAFVAQAMIEMAPLGLHLENAPIINLPGGASGVSSWPLPNVWLGVSAEDQPRLDQRIFDLQNTPAAIRWLSAEPLLAPLDLEHAGLVAREFGGEYASDVLRGALLERDGPDDPWTVADIHNRKLDWVVVGGESGAAARPMHPDWVRDIRDQCAAAGVPFLFKQWGNWAPGENVGPVTGPSVGADLNDDGSWHRTEFTQRAAEDLHIDDEPVVWRADKKRTGRMLDAVTHDAFPLVGR